MTDCVGGVVVNDPSGWRGIGRRAERTGGGFRQDPWNEGWIQRVRGSFRWMTAGLMTLSTTKGPMNLGDSFLASVLRGKFLVESHTWSPGV